ncbi:Sphingolipid C4-hydroxylase SUR2 [Hypsizygus marmoreus]|uniref:Sphingolipid C4-hydroxylase SUR2 n=1 Tax=Hypsizygus marmoreus TaxID=39966 RepID=A0A369JJZ0_HYPMA|nr:Sphingolipid C4-hydroxylase SUR2 [Hypsizygus marmoreus]
MNASSCAVPLDDLQFHTYVPFYHSNAPTLIDGVPDHYLALAAPVLAYWSLSLFFHYLDMSDWKWLDKYRIHESAEVQKRNLATRTQVVWAVILQQIIQTLLGLVWLSDEAKAGVNHLQEMQAIAVRLQPLVCGALGEYNVHYVLRDLSYFVYWWGIPSIQFLTAMFIIDTWQYFLHRLMHVNKFLYKQFHSVHHRLYVPYAFGSLYNHPIEGFVLDSLGAAMAELLTGMNTRQAMLLFSFSTFKTVDDHCGYSLPWDPLQLLTGNNADYHDIHHQVIGIKSNFSQPFFIHWDSILGTRMTRGDIELRKQKQGQGLVGDKTE